MSLRIIYAEDDPVCAKNILHQFTSCGYDVKWFSEGEAALAAMKTNPPDILVTDLDMPKMDGWELIKKVLQDSNLAEIPIVIYTSQTDEGLEEQAAVMDIPFVAKDEGFDRLNSIIQFSTELSFSGSYSHEIPNEIMENFLKETEKKIEKIAGLIETLSISKQEDAVLEEIHSNIHKIKGASGLYGFDKMCRLSGRLNELLKTIKYSPLNEEALDLLKKGSNLLKGSLNKESALTAEEEELLEKIKAYSEKTK